MPKRINRDRIFSNAVNVIVATKRLATKQIHRSRILIIGQSKNIHPPGVVEEKESIEAEEEPPPPVKKMGKEICTFEESPFYVHKACAQGLIKIVEKLILEDPSRVSLQDKAGLTCLHHAVSRNRFQIIDFLLKNGADINARTPEGNTSLHIAVEKGRADTVKHLLLARIDGNVINAKRMAAIHLAASLGNQDVVTELCNFPSLVDVNLKGYRGQLALHFAAMGDKVEAAEVLLKAGCKLDYTSENGFYPVHVAAKCGSVKVLQLFLEVDFYPWANLGYTTKQLLAQIDKEKNNALHMAVNSGNLQSVSICLKYGAAVDVRQEDSSTPLHLACAQGSLSIVKILYETHVDRTDEDEARVVLETKDVLDMSLLHRAAMFDHPDVVQYLLDQKADIEATDQEKRTPLVLAVACSAFRAFRCLLNNSANLAAVDRNKRNIVHYLVGRTMSSAFTPEEFLALCQTEDGKRLLNQKDALGCTPLHLAAKEGTVRCIDTFIPLGANINLKDADDRCALHFAARYGRYNVVKQLLESPGAVNILNESDGQGMTALHIASMNGHTKVVQLLLYKGALLHKDYMGRSPLHLAAQNDFVKTMELLLSFHHNLLDQRDRKGNTALHYSVQANRTRPTDMLLTKGCVYSVNDDLETPMDIAIANQFLEVALNMVKHKRWNEILDYRGAEAFMGLIRHLPQICRVVLDRCQTRAICDPQSHYYWEKYNFRYLQPARLAIIDPDERKRRKIQPLEALNAMVIHQRVDLLAHPVSHQYLRMKWRAYGLWMFTAHLIFYAIFVASFTAALWSLSNDDDLDDGKVNKILAAMGRLNETGDALVDVQRDLQVTDAYYTAHAVVFALILINMVKEFVQIYQQRLFYFADGINLLEWALYITGLISTCNTLFNGTITDIAWQCGAVAIFLAWFNLLIHLQRLDSTGLYVVMFLQILKTMIRVILVFSVLIVAFGLTFYMLLANTDAHGYMNPTISIVRSVMLMMGDFDFVNTFVQSYTQKTLRFPFLSYAFLLIFVVLVPILFVNLLIGLAVGDIEMVQKDAKLKRLAMQVEYHTELEKKLPQWLLNRMDKMELIVYPNRFSFRSKTACITAIKSLFDGSIFRRNIKGDLDQPLVVTASSEAVHRDNIMRQDPMLLELTRTKKKLRNVQHQMRAVRELLQLVVRKMDIKGDDVDCIDGGLDLDDDDDDESSESRCVAATDSASLIPTTSGVEKWKIATKTKMMPLVHMLKKSK